MSLVTRHHGDVKGVRNMEDMAAQISELEVLAIELAEIEVTAGNLVLEDIPENLQDQVRVKIDDDKWIDK